MRVLPLISQKGGAGKSVLTFCLAVAAEQAGYRILILDMDPQGTAEAWYQDREQETPWLARVASTELESALARGAASFDFVLIDTPGRDEPSTAAAIRETGAVKPKVYRRGMKPKVDKAGEDYLQGVLLQVPELTLRELCVRYEEHVGLPVSTSTMDRTLRRLHLTRKKSSIKIHKEPASGFSS